MERARAPTFEVLPAADPFVQLPCLLGGFDVQLIRQGAAASLVLHQRGRTLPALCEETHELPVPRLLPRLDGQPAPYVAADPRWLAARRIDLAQILQRTHHLALQPLPGQECPVLERGAIRHRQPLQEGATIESGRFLQPARAGVALREGGRRLWDRAVCLLMRFDQRCKRLHVDPAVTGGVELDRLARDRQDRGRGPVVGDGFAQDIEDVAQVGVCLALCVIGPQETGERAAMVGTTRLYCHVGQQCADLDRLEPTDRFAIQRDPKGSQQ